MTKTILFVLTGHSELGDTRAKTGVWLEELATPYQMAKAAGAEILFATPGGKPAPLDPASLDEPWLLPAGHWFLDQQEVIAQLETPLDIKDVDALGLDAAFLVGGTGTLWDFPACEPLGALITALDRQGKIVAAICHGVVGLMTAKGRDGAPFAMGRSLTCFSNEEETMLEYDKLVPLLAETELVRQGAVYSQAEPFQPKVVEDGQLITGQNPASAEPLAWAMLQKLGIGTI